MAKRIALIVLAILALVAIIRSEPPEPIEYEHIDKSMPRSHNVFSMETGDAEYLEWERNNHGD